MLKIVIAAGLGFIVLLTLVVVVKFYVLSPRMRQALDAKALATPEALASGKYLVDNAATGIASNSESDLLRVLNEGIGKAGQALYSMPWRYYAGMTDPDKRALIEALSMHQPW